MDEKYQDVEFEDTTDSDKHIRGKILYFSTSQVSQALNVADSKIRYYTSVFSELLDIKISNKQRQYTDKDIEKLKFIIELKDSGMTIRQIQEYCQEVSFDEHSGIQVKETNPLSIQTMSKALLEEQHKQMAEFKEEMLKVMSVQLTNQLEALKLNNEDIKNKIIEQVSVTVDEVMNSKLTGVIETQREIKELHHKNQEDLKEFVAITIDNMEQEVSRKLIEREDNLKHNMELRKVEQELIESRKTKSWWNRLTNK